MGTVEEERHCKAKFFDPTRERRHAPFLAWGDFHARSRFARSTIPEEKWVTTRSLFDKRIKGYFNLWSTNP